MLYSPGARAPGPGSSTNWLCVITYHSTSIPLRYQPACLLFHQPNYPSWCLEGILRDCRALSFWRFLFLAWKLFATVTAHLGPYPPSCVESLDDMAIYSAVPPPEEGSPAYNTATQAQAQAPQGSLIDIDAWTVSALQSLAVSPIARGTGTPLTIPIDEPTPVKQSPRAVKISESAAVEVSFTPPRRPPSRRDSQVHRNALLKGKEGSRQRRRWENGIVLALKR